MSRPFGFSSRRTTDEVRAHIAPTSSFRPKRERVGMADPREMNLAQLNSVDALASAAESCTGCELYEDATRVVFGRGPMSALDDAARRTTR